jgi:hypothetical protein
MWPRLSKVKAMHRNFSLRICDDSWNSFTVATGLLPVSLPPSFDGGLQLLGEVTVHFVGFFTGVGTLVEIGDFLVAESSLVSSLI